MKEKKVKKEMLKIINSTAYRIIKEGRKHPVDMVEDVELIKSAIAIYNYYSIYPDMLNFEIILHDKYVEYCDSDVGIMGKFWA